MPVAFSVDDVDVPLRMSRGQLHEAGPLSGCRPVFVLALSVLAKALHDSVVVAKQYQC